MLLAWLLAAGPARPETDVCDSARMLVGGGATRIVPIHALLVVWEGRALLTPLGRRNRSGPSCAVWVESPLPPNVKQHVFQHLREMMSSSVNFEVTLRGRIERAWRFQKASAPPYPGNGFGLHGSYEFRVFVQEWLSAKPQDGRRGSDALRRPKDPE